MRSDKTSSSRVILSQDLGVLLYIICVTGAALVTVLAGQEYIYQNTAMLLAIAFSSMLTAMRARTAGAVTSALTVLVFTGYKLYMRLAYNDPIEISAYLWPVLVLSALGGITLFVSMYSVIENVNGLLNRRLDELTVMDPLTGLENMRSMVSSLGRYMALSERNGTGMGLMMVRLRYADEIQKILSRDQFNSLRALMALTVQDVLRLEDRVFSLDDKGSLGIIYFSKEEGAQVVKNRVHHAIAEKDMLPDLNERMLTVELSIVYRQYTKDLGKDAMRFVTEVEKEFAYEV